MESSGDGDLEGVAMPGFIDILSSVVTVFMFFMLITSATMFFLSMKIKNDAQQQVKEKEQQVDKKLQEIIDKLKSGELTIDDIKNMKSKGASDAADGQSKGDSQNTQQESIAKFSKSDSSQSAKVDSSSKEMVIKFKSNSITVTDDTVKSLESFLGDYKAKNNGQTPKSITIESSDNPESASLSLSRETELGRELNVRNVLLDKKIAPEIITVHNVDATKEDGDYNWVKIHVDK